VEIVKNWCDVIITLGASDCTGQSILDALESVKVRESMCRLGDCCSSLAGNRLYCRQWY
jgi:hypothetical protein